MAGLTLAEIQALDNAYWFVAGLWGDQTRPASEYSFRGVRTGAVEPPPGFEADDFRVATFREVAERLPHHVLDVEIKLQRGADGEEDPAHGHSHRRSSRGRDRRAGPGRLGDRGWLQR